MRGRQLVFVFGIAGRHHQKGDDQKHEAVGGKVDLVEHQEIADVGQGCLRAELQSDEREKGGDRKTDARLDVLGLQQQGCGGDENNDENGKQGIPLPDYLLNYQR